MASVGERLRHLRETRNMTIEEMVTATGIGRSYLEALEKDAIHELPGKAFGKLYIRAYAEVFTFDPQPFIDDYDREQRLVAGVATESTTAAPAGSRPVAAAIAQWKAARAAAPEPTELPEPVEPHEPVEPPEAAIEVVVSQPEAGAPPARRRLAPFAIAGIVVIAVAIYLGSRTDRPSHPTSPESRPAEASAPAPAPAPVPVPPPAVVPPEPRAVQAPVPREAAVGALRVTESGVGRRIANLKLEGESDRFEPGTRVSFATRVLGGRRGEVIGHAWLRDGRLEQTIPLRLGGPDWRTHSNKTLGRAGAWAVEARDETGRVLARVEFNCGP